MRKREEQDLRKKQSRQTSGTPFGRGGKRRQNGSKIKNWGGICNWVEQGAQDNRRGKEKKERKSRLCVERQRNKKAPLIGRILRNPQKLGSEIKKGIEGGKRTTGIMMKRRDKL